MIRTVFGLLYVVFYLVCLLPVYGIFRLIGLKNPAKRDALSCACVKWGFKCLYTVCGVKVEARGRDLIPDGKAVLYVSNHRSYFDIITSDVFVKGITGYIAKEQVKKIPFLVLWMNAIGCVYISRDDPRESMKAIQKATDNIKNGISMYLFPEGHRSHTHSLLDFQEGGMRVALKGGCPVVPVAICNTGEILEDHLPRVVPQHVVIEFGRPIYPEELSKEEKKHLAQSVKGVIQEMLDRNYAELERRGLGKR